MYTIERNYCNCHPETCNCNPWIIKKDGNFFLLQYIVKKNGKLIVKAMNEMEQRKKTMKKILIVLLFVLLFTSCGYIVKELNPFIVGESDHYEETYES